MGHGGLPPRLNRTRHRALCLRCQVTLSTSGRVCYRPILQRETLRLGELGSLPKATEPSRGTLEGSEPSSFPFTPCQSPGSSLPAAFRTASAHSAAPGSGTPMPASAGQPSSLTAEVQTDPPQGPRGSGNPHGPGQGPHRCTRAPRLGRGGALLVGLGTQSISCAPSNSGGTRLSGPDLPTRRPTCPDPGVKVMLPKAVRWELPPRPSHSTPVLPVPRRGDWGPDRL